MVVIYPHPLEERDVGALTFLDQCLRGFSVAIRHKPNWMEKIMDRKLLTKWIREAAAQDMEQLANGNDNVIVWDANAIQVVDAELKEIKAYIEKLRESGSCIEPEIDAVWKADEFIDEELKKELIDAVATLENVPEEQKDWHPGTNDTVLDLVHPSLWPVIYGKSISIDGKILECPAEALIWDRDSDEDEDEDEDEEYGSDDSEDSYDSYTFRRNPSKSERRMNGYSKKFCWLPSEFEVSADGKSTKIASYINNLSEPGQQELFYPILERVFTKFVPMFNHLLADLAQGNHTRHRTGEPTEVTDYNGEETQRIFPKKIYEEAWGKLLEEFENGQQLTVDFEELTIDKSEYEYGDGEKKWSHKQYELWDLGGAGGGWSPPNITDDVKLEGKTVKVIVKLANIILTPENPDYEGGSWHVEAMKNERIVATGIYYYSQENITDSTLLFRRTVDVPRNPRVQYSSWGKVHDMNEYLGVQEIGEIDTTENRAIVFPNVYQHCVSEFSLKDRTKPGHRKILVFFLCDPSGDHEIPTTKTVAPQQPELRAELENALRAGRPGTLSEELFQMIIKDLPPAISLEEAKQYRAELMKERSRFTNKSSMVQGVQYNFCEH
ncbi:hypothetical protein TWF281_010710 [Arthrobotrys megalospora]